MTYSSLTRLVRLEAALMTRTVDWRELVILLRIGQHLRKAGFHEV